MLFSRREKLPLSRKILGLLWPRIGFRRSLSYLRHRVARLPGTAHSIAVGFATGAALSVTPFMGFHFALSALIAWLLGGNLLAAALGTLIGNPWTFPIFWVWTYRLGCLIMGLEAVARPLAGFRLIDIFQNPLAALGPVVLPMLVGSVPSAFVIWWLSYWPVKKLVGEYKRKRIEMRHRRVLELMEQKRALQNDQN